MCANVAMVHIIQFSNALQAVEYIETIGCLYASVLELFMSHTPWDLSYIIALSLENWSPKKLVRRTNIPWKDGPSLEFLIPPWDQYSIEFCS